MSEHAEQSALIYTCRTLENKIPELKLLFAIPNGFFIPGDIKAGAKIKQYFIKEGLREGVLDLFLPVPRHGKNGLFIEMKNDKNKLTKEQEEFKNQVQANLYKVVVCYSMEEALTEVLHYAINKTPIECGVLLNKDYTPKS